MVLEGAVWSGTVAGPIQVSAGHLRPKLFPRENSLMRRILFAFALLCSATMAAERPNIVLIISDDQAWNDYGFMGHDVIQTPQLDQLAARSAVFRRGYVPTALCRPSLATLVTGLYASQHGITGNDPAKPGATPLSVRREKLISKIDQTQTLPRLLGAAGYRSHQSGKWWEGNYSRGGFTDGMTRGFPQPGGRHGDDGLKIGREGMQPVLQFIDDAVEASEPFFVWYAPFLPHTPHNPPDRLLKKYEQKDRPVRLAKYFAMCEWFDETCGQLVDHLDTRKVRDNTLIVYVTDNGWIQRTPQTEVTSDWKSQFAPRSKQSPNEGGVRTPVMLSWPGMIPPADRPELVSSIDLFPTILAAAGISAPDDRPGINLLPVAQDGAALERDTIFGESFAHDIVDLEDPQATLLYRWVIRDQWKLILCYDGQVSRYPFVHEPALQGPQVYNLQTDPHEEHNVATNEPQIVNELSGLLTDWWMVERRSLYSGAGRQ